MTKNFELCSLNIHEDVVVAAVVDVVEVASQYLTKRQRRESVKREAPDKPEPDEEDESNPKNESESYPEKNTLQRSSINDVTKVLIF